MGAVAGYGSCRVGDNSSGSPWVMLGAREDGKEMKEAEEGEDHDRLLLAARVWEEKRRR